MDDAAMNQKLAINTSEVLELEGEEEEEEEDDQSGEGETKVEKSAIVVSLASNKKKEMISDFASEDGSRREAAVEFLERKELLSKEKREQKRATIAMTRGRMKKKRMKSVGKSVGKTTPAPSESAAAPVRDERGACNLTAKSTCPPRVEKMEKRVDDIAPPPPPPRLTSLSQNQPPSPPQPTTRAPVTLAATIRRDKGVIVPPLFPPTRATLLSLPLKPPSP